VKPWYLVAQEFSYIITVAENQNGPFCVHLYIRRLWRSESGENLWNDYV